jgi:hypothetical protein
MRPDQALRQDAGSARMFETARSSMAVDPGGSTIHIASDAQASASMYKGCNVSVSALAVIDSTESAAAL